MSDTPKPGVIDGSSSPDGAAAAEGSPPASGPEKWLQTFAEIIPLLIVVAITISVTSIGGIIAEWYRVVVPLAVMIAVLFLIGVLMPSGRRWLKDSKATTRATLFFVGALPVLVVFEGGMAALGAFFQFTALRAAFLIVVCLLPASMWYLFVMTRKASLLNEFLVNLARLGLLSQVASEDKPARGRRVQSYLQKFEAIYGDLSPNVHRDALEDRLRTYSKADIGGVVTLSTATVPVVLSTFLIALGWIVVLPPYVPDVVIGKSPGVQALSLSGAPVQLAFLGAYFFSLQMLFRRYVLEDLGGSAYVAVSIRIILAVIGVWTLTAVCGEKEQLLRVAGFVFGFFPKVIWELIVQLFEMGAGLLLPSLASKLPINDLDGLTVWHEVRLEEEDIENIPNMATADIVELLLNTRLPPERIIDWVDQAILYTQLGTQPKLKEGRNARERLRAHGIRTASSLLWASAEAHRQGRAETFDRILQGTDGPSAMHSLEASLRTNSNLNLIEHWRRICTQRPSVPPNAEGSTLQLPEPRDSEVDPGHAVAAA